MLYQETNVQNVINVLEAKGAEGMIQPAFECITLLGSLSKHAPENKTKTTPVQCFCFLTWAVYLKIYNSKGKGESIHFLPASWKNPWGDRRILKICVLERCQRHIACRSRKMHLNKYLHVFTYKHRRWHSREQAFRNLTNLPTLDHTLGQINNHAHVASSSQSRIQTRALLRIWSALRESLSCGEFYWSPDELYSSPGYPLFDLKL